MPRLFLLTFMAFLGDKVPIYSSRISIAGLDT